MDRICKTCKEAKPCSEYFWRKDRNTWQSMCKICCNEKNRIWRSKNKDVWSEYNRKWRLNNPERYKEVSSAANKKIYDNNKLRFMISNAIYRALSGRRKEIPTFDKLGYTLQDLKSHLESLFSDGMSWDNYGEWHIDHIVPMSAFKIDTFECDNFKKAWALSNLQPLWAVDNLRKGNRT